MAYPDSFDLLDNTHLDNVDEVIAADHVNSLATAIMAVQTELGLVPSGSHDDVAARLVALEGVLDSYTVLGHTTRRTLDKSTATLSEVVDVLCTLIADIKALS